jgi:hypothetical protein
MIEELDPAVVIRLLLNISGWLLGLCTILLVGIVGFFVAWQRRQDSTIAQLRDELTEYREAAAYIKRLGDHNIPDAWKEADRSKDLLIEKLTSLCLGFCGKSVEDLNKAVKK